MSRREHLKRFESDACAVTRLSLLTLFCIVFGAIINRVNALQSTPRPEPSLETRGDTNDN